MTHKLLGDTSEALKPIPAGNLYAMLIGLSRQTISHHLA